jgi:hypothetical protein
MLGGRAIIDKSLKTSGKKENNSSLKIKQNTGNKTKRTSEQSENPFSSN